MNSATNRRAIVLIAALAVLLASCGSDSADEASAEATSSETTAATTPDTSASVTDTAEDTASEDDEADADAGVDLFPAIDLGATEPGPRPTLSWSAVDGAALYQLTVLDADGVPYWSWSGADTSVPLGGMENPDAMGAWVFEELSWMVVARDEAGAPLGMSPRGVLLP